MTNDSVLRCKLYTEEKLIIGALISGERHLSGTIPGTLIFHAGGDAKEYDGPYEVTPMLQPQTLETSGLVMKADMSIKKIPIAEVTNNSGGITVIIGG